MTMPDPMHTIRVWLANQSAVSTPTEGRVYAYRVPRHVVDGGLLRKILLVRPSGRSPSVGDRSRALIGRPRFDLWAYGETEDEAFALLWAAHELLKELSRERVELADGDALLHDVVVEGGPLSFDDPDSDAPVALGVYSADIAEEYLPPPMGS